MKCEELKYSYVKLVVSVNLGKESVVKSKQNWRLVGNVTWLRVLNYLHLNTIMTILAETIDKCWGAVFSSFSSLLI